MNDFSYGISQNLDTKDHIMVRNYAEGRRLNNLIKKDNNWYFDLFALELIVKGLGKIHEKKMVHRDFHIGIVVVFHIFQIWDYVEKLIM